MDWYYNDGTQKVGPVTEADIEHLVREGVIQPDTLVWNELTSQWQPYAQASAGPSGPTESQQQRGDTPSGTTKIATVPDEPSEGKKEAVCSECGREFPENDVVPYGELRICASCKPVFFQKLQEGAHLPNAMVYAGFWIRFGAKIIDSIIVSIVNTIFSSVAGFVTASSFAVSNEQSLSSTFPIMLYFIIMLVQLAFHITYKTFFVGKFAATPGKMACSIKIVTEDGGRVSYARAFGRYFAEMLSGLIFLIGYIMAAFDDEKRALHDRICNTRVIKK